MGPSNTIWANPSEYLKQHRPDAPVMFFSPKVLQETAARFLNGFPGMVTYAVKSNPDDIVIQNLAAAGLKGFDVASPAEMEQISTGDHVYYHVPAAASESSTDASGVHLLPAFDEYYLGYAQREMVLAAGLDKRVVSSNGIFHPMIVVDGQIAGTWRSVRKGQSVRIRPELFDALDSAGKAALYEAMQRFATFLGATLIA